MKDSRSTALVATITLASAFATVTMSMAAAEPYPWHEQPNDPVVASPAEVTKAQIEHRERLTAGGSTSLINEAEAEYWRLLASSKQRLASASQGPRSKAQIEYVERLQSEHRELLTGIRTGYWQRATAGGDLPGHAQVESLEPVSAVRSVAGLDRESQFTKAQIEYWERVSTEAPVVTKAQVEHGERLAAGRGAHRDQPSGSSALELAGFCAIGLAGLALGGAGVLSGRRVR